jgi:multiple sugar transport system permease protein
MSRRTAYAIFIHVLGWSIALIWIIPFFGVLMTALRPLSEIIHGWWRFESFTPSFANFVEAWNHPTAALGTGMRNSLTIAIPATVVPILVGSIAAYGLARFKFRMRNYLFVAIVALMTLPQQMIALPIFRLMNDLRLLDTFLGLIIVHSAWGIPWILFFLRNFFTTLPVEIEEAARVDGASDLRIFFRIILPMSIPALISAAVLQFMWVWSDFFLALILMYTPSNLLATQRIPLLRGQFHVDWGVLSAGTILVMILPVLVFAFLQRYYIKGMVGWSTK